MNDVTLLFSSREGVSLGIYAKICYEQNLFRNLARHNTKIKGSYSGRDSGDTNT